MGLSANAKNTASKLGKNIAIAVNANGRREIFGLHTGPSEAEMFSMKPQRGLKTPLPALEGVRLVVNGAPMFLKTAIGRAPAPPGSDATCLG